MNDYTDDEFLYITRTVMNVLDSWNLSTEETVNVLGLSSQTRKRQLDKYRTLKAFPKDDLIIKRLSHIVGISDALGGSAVALATSYSEARRHTTYYLGSQA